MGSSFWCLEDFPFVFDPNLVGTRSGLGRVAIVSNPAPLPPSQNLTNKFTFVATKFYMYV